MRLCVLAKKILIIQLRQLGDVLLTTPCVQTIKKDSPDHHITFLSHAMGCHVLAENPYIDDHLYLMIRVGRLGGFYVT